MVLVGTERLKHQQCFREGPGGAGHEQGAVVAAVLPFDTDLPGKPPSDRVKEEQDFNEGLEHVHEVIPSGNVLQLVREDRLELVGGERGECRGGYQNQRSHPANDHR